MASDSCHSRHFGPKRGHFAGARGGAYHKCRLLALAWEYTPNAMASTAGRHSQHSPPTDSRHSDMPQRLHAMAGDSCHSRHFGPKRGHFAGARGKVTVHTRWLVAVTRNRLHVFAMGRGAPRSSDY
jgi:hypothetical protein